jgi:hypothetical protein
MEATSTLTEDYIIDIITDNEVEPVIPTSRHRLVLLISMINKVISSIILIRGMGNGGLEIARIQFIFVDDQLNGVIIFKGV